MYCAYEELRAAAVIHRIQSLRPVLSARDLGRSTPISMSI
jgi:hypothetical protein